MYEIEDIIEFNRGILVLRENSDLSFIDATSKVQTKLTTALAITESAMCLQKNAVISLSQRGDEWKFRELSIAPVEFKECPVMPMWDLGPESFLVKTGITSHMIIGRKRAFCRLRLAHEGITIENYYVTGYRNIYITDLAVNPVDGDVNIFRIEFPESSWRSKLVRRPHTFDAILESTKNEIFQFTPMSSSNGLRKLFDIRVAATTMAMKDINTGIVVSDAIIGFDMRARDRRVIQCVTDCEDLVPISIGDRTSRNTAAYTDDLFAMLCTSCRREICAVL